jgi:hypothetical protein
MSVEFSNFTWSMKKLLFILVSLFFSVMLFAQKVDSIYFHLYTDSLKKGRHNYINIDGKLSNGQWQPLSAKEVQLSSNVGAFEGNDLVLPANMKQEKVTVKAVLKSNPAIWREVTIWIKTVPEPDKLPTNEEILKQPRKKSKSKEE